VSNERPALTVEQINAYAADGYLVLHDWFDADEVDLLGDEFEKSSAEDSRAVVREDGSDVVRGVHGTHAGNTVFSRLVRLERMLQPARQLLDDDVYVHQFKINAKRALVGDLWEWHQDFQFWRIEDGMREPRAVNFAVFLDDVTEFNGPLMVVPGSHTGGTLPVVQRSGIHWRDTLAARLKYEITPDTLRTAVRDRGLVAPKGTRGTVLIFHCNILHGSAPNMSAEDRRVLLVSYNSARNTLAPLADPRPEFLASHDFTPLTALPDDSLRALCEVSRDAR